MDPIEEVESATALIMGLTLTQYHCLKLSTFGLRPVHCAALLGVSLKQAEADTEHLSQMGLLAR